MSKRRLAKQTTKALKKMGAKEQINSGAGDNKGDAIKKLDRFINYGMYNKFLIESKATDNVSFSLKLDTLKKIRKEAQQMSCAMPIVQNIMIDKDKKQHEFITMFQSDFNDLIEWINDIWNTETEGKR